MYTSGVGEGGWSTTCPTPCGIHNECYILCLGRGGWQVISSGSQILFMETRANDKMTMVVECRISLSLEGY
jgi:hypothetical protein